MTTNKEIIESLKMAIANIKFEILEQEKKLDELTNQLINIKYEKIED